MATQYEQEKQAKMLAKFDALQEKLVPLWKQIGRTDPGSIILEEANTVVVLPSITVDLEIDIASQQAYEERMLFMLLLLRQPHIRLIYITSLPVPDFALPDSLDEFGIPRGTRLGLRNLSLDNTVTHFVIDGDLRP